MRKLTIVVCSAVATLATSAQQPQCTNEDIVNGLVYMGRSEMKAKVSRGSPGFMGNFRAPEGFSLIGTAVRDNDGRASMTSVAYKTSLASDKAYAALVAALGTEGWATENTSGGGNAFNVAGAPKDGTLCRNGERRSVMATEAGGSTYVSIHSYPESRPRDCNAPDTRSDLRTMQDAVPRFQFPAGTSLAQGGFGGGGGSSQSWRTTSRIISADSAARLVEHLASQIEGQGWRADSGWTGAGSAGSTWTKKVDGQASVGTLDILRVSEGTYDVNFTMSTP